MNDRRAAADAGVHDIRDVVAETSELGGASARAAPSARDAFAAVAAGRARLRAPRAADARPAAARSGPAPAGRLPGADARADVHRRRGRPAPRRATRQPPPPVADDEAQAKRRALRPKRSVGELIKGAAALLIVAGLGGVLLWQWPNMVALYQKMRTPAASEVRDVPAAGTRSTKITDRIEPGVQPSQGTADTAPAAPGAAVAQKVVLYEEDPADPQRQALRRLGDLAHRDESRPAPASRPSLRSAPTSRCPTAS